MKNVSGTLEKDVAELKRLLPAEDILTFAFQTQAGVAFTCVFVDAITDKELLGEQVVRPLLHYEGTLDAENVGKKLTSPELRQETSFELLAEEILAGNPVVLWEGADQGIIAGTKKVFVRAIAEPPTDVTIKGPREGFIEDVKINVSLVRRRLKTPELKVEMIKVGRRSQTFVAVCYLEGTTPQKLVDAVKEKLEKKEVS